MLGIDLVPYLPVTPTSVGIVSYSMILRAVKAYSSCASSWLRLVWRVEMVVDVVAAVVSWKFVVEEIRLDCRMRLACITRAKQFMQRG